MKSYAAVFILCVLGFVLSQDDGFSYGKEPTPAKTQPAHSTSYSTVPKSNEPESTGQPRSNTAVTPPGNTTQGPKRTETVPTGHLTSSSYPKSKPLISRSSVSDSNATPAKPTCSTGYSAVPNSKGTGQPTHTSNSAMTPSYPTSSGHKNSNSPISRKSSASGSSYNQATPAKPQTAISNSRGISRGQPTYNATTLSSTESQKPPPGNTGVPKSSGGAPAGRPPSTTSDQMPISPISRGTSSGNIPTLSASSESIQTTLNSTTPGYKTGTPTLTVSNGETASATVGMIVVGAGIGGSIIVGGSTFPIDGGTEVIIEENDTGRDGPVTISSDDSISTPTRTRTTTTTTTPTRTTTRRTTTIPKTPSSSSTSLSSSTSSSTAGPTPYNIYPIVGSTLSQQSAFAQNLGQIAQAGSVRSITGGRGRLLLWRASLTPAQASELSRNAVVRGLNVDRQLPVVEEPSRASESASSSSPNCPPENCSRKRDGSILMQQDAPEDLKIYSQARGAPLSTLPGYAYDARGGRGITIYVIDTGINPNHEELRDMLGTLRWLHLPGDPHLESDEDGHGTCVISKIIGPTLGVAKSANIVVVKLHPIDGFLHVSRVISAWGVVAADIASGNLEGKSVVISAMGVRPADLTVNDKVTYIESLRDVIGLDAVVVSSSGNINAMVPGFGLSLYPVLLATEIGLPIIIVGAVDITGFYEAYSQGLASELTVSAVGTVRCASHNGGFVRWSGTSFAAPSVAGLAAYLMSLDRYNAQIQVPGFVAKNVRILIQSLAYERMPLQPAVVWNGIDSRQIYYCPIRRDAESSGCQARNATSITMSPPTTTVASSSSILTDSNTMASSSSTMPETTDTASSTSTMTGNGGESTIITILLSGLSKITAILKPGSMRPSQAEPGTVV